MGYPMLNKEENLPEYTLPRVYLPGQTLGSIYSPTGELICKTMELPWRNNARNKDSGKASCIPEGRYLVTMEPPKAGREYSHFRLHGTEPRQGILIHRITNVEHLLGCIGVGAAHKNLDKDADYEIVESGATLQAMVDTLPKRFYLVITTKKAA